jgi:hypothetical protein
MPVMVTELRINQVRSAVESSKHVGTVLALLLRDETRTLGKDY